MVKKKGEGSGDVEFWVVHNTHCPYKKTQTPYGIIKKMAWVETFAEVVVQVHVMAMVDLMVLGASVGFYATAVALHWVATQDTFRFGVARGALALQPLPDRLHTLLPPPSPGLKMATSACIWVSILHFAWCLWAYGPAAPALSLLLVTKGALYILRAATFWCTVLPDPTMEGKRPKTFFMGATFDLLFSGHMTFTLVFLLVALRFGWVASLPARAFWVAFQAAHALGIVASRHHYTVDVWVAAWATPLVFACVSGWMEGWVVGWRGTGW